MKVILELGNKNSAPSICFEIHNPTVTLKKESVQEIVVETLMTAWLSGSARIGIHCTGCN